MRGKFEDLTGMNFGNWTVIKQEKDYISKNGRHYSQWLCECNCENKTTKIVSGSNLTSGKSKSCGCLRKELLHHKYKKYNDYEIQEDYVIMYTMKGEIFLVDLEDFWRIKDICWHKDKDGYIKGHENGKSVSIHRLIMNPPDEFDVDHKRGKASRIDNRKCNLRIVTHQENSCNHPVPSDNTSDAIGVSWHKASNKWRAYIGIDGKCVHLGCFNNKEDAIAIRKTAEEKYFGEYSYDNSQKQFKEGELTW